MSTQIQRHDALLESVCLFSFGEVGGFCLGDTLVILLMVQTSGEHQLIW